MNTLKLQSSLLLVLVLNTCGGWKHQKQFSNHHTSIPIWGSGFQTIQLKFKLLCIDNTLSRQYLQKCWNFINETLYGNWKDLVATFRVKVTVGTSIYIWLFLLSSKLLILFQANLVWWYFHKITWVFCEKSGLLCSRSKQRYKISINVCLSSVNELPPIFGN